MTKRKPKGYWQNPKNFEAEMLQAIKENNGEFPIGPRLREMGKSSLGNAISTYYDGFPAVKKRMGFEVEETPDWQDEDYFLLEMRKAIKENNGKFPTQRRLREVGKRGLVKAIYNFYDGMEAVRERIGFGENDNINHLEIILTNYIGEKVT